MLLQIKLSPQVTKVQSLYICLGILCCMHNAMSAGLCFLPSPWCICNIAGDRTWWPLGSRPILQFYDSMICSSEFPNRYLPQPEIIFLSQATVSSFSKTEIPAVGLGSRAMKHLFACPVSNIHIRKSACVCIKSPPGIGETCMHVYWHFFYFPGSRTDW